MGVCKSRKKDIDLKKKPREEEFPTPFNPSENTSYSISYEKDLNKDKSIEEIENTSGKYFPNKGVKETLIKVKVDENAKTYLNNEFIFILDISGSMGTYVNQILTKVIPKVYEKLQYPDDKYFHLITFENKVTYYKMNKKDFMRSTITGDGGTEMSKVPNKLEEILNKINSDVPINILTLSDGEISDQESTKINADNLYNRINKKFDNINSQAIRFISYENAQPDTRALCSLLRFNTKNIANKEKLMETFSPVLKTMSKLKIDEFSNKIANLFKVEISGWKIICKDGEKKLKIEPLGELRDSLFLNKGQSVFFYDGVFDNLPDLVNLSSTDGSSVKDISYGKEVTQENLNEIYHDTIYGIVDKIIINKCVDSDESNKKNEEYIKYVEMLETQTKETDVIKPNNKLSKKLKNIVENEEVKNLNSEKLNDFIQKQKEECIEELNEIQDEINKIVKEIHKLKIDNRVFILLLDNSIFMKNYIDNLIQNVIYNSLIKIGLSEKTKIKIFGNGYEHNLIIKKLKNLIINCEGERNVFETLNLIGEEILKDPVKSYNLISLFSGEIIDKEKVRDLAFRMYGIQNKVQINSRVIKYITEESNFPKNENGEIDESKEDSITYGLIKQLNTDGMESCKPIVIEDKFPNSQKIDIFTEMFNFN